ncbi:MAG: hypothetical protein GSR75_00355 [Desulfurococcales archaeon]|nr:hypothetical protein [Desulfurococcales archaeon]
MYLATLIEKAYRYNGIITAYVFGEFGYGKTSYALWNAYEIYGSWEKALSHLYFKPEDVIKDIGKAIKTGKRIPLIIMDDAGLWLDKLTWWEESKIRFMELFNLIRSVAAGVIFTTPSEELPKQILNKAFFRIKIEPADPGSDEVAGQTAEYARRAGLKPLVSKAIGYRLKTLPSFMKIVRKTYIDYYPTHYPVYEEYEKKRKAALSFYFDRLKESVKPSGKRARDLELREIRNMILQGFTTKEIVAKLLERGVPRATAYRWVKRVRDEMLTLNA